jgi:transcriptional regulator with XRE-family HTH domain
MQALLTPVVDCHHWKEVLVVVTGSSLRTMLAIQRRELGLTQSDIGKRIDLKRGMVSILERDHEELIERGPEFTLKFLKAYGFSDAKAREITRKLFEGVLKELVVDSDPLERFRSTEEWVYYQVFTSASAGTGEPEIVDGEVAAIPRSALRARGITADMEHEVMPVRVNGNCLVSQNVRFSNKNVSHGDHVFIHLGAPPQDGDRVCCFDHTDNQLIIKFYKEAQDPSNPDEIVFYDARGVQHVRNVRDIEYKGVVFWRSGGL